MNAKIIDFPSPSVSTSMPPAILKSELADAGPAVACYLMNPRDVVVASPQLTTIGAAAFLKLLEKAIAQ